MNTNNGFYFPQQEIDTTHAYNNAMNYDISDFDQVLLDFSPVKVAAERNHAFQQLNVVVGEGDGAPAGINGDGPLHVCPLFKQRNKGRRAETHSLNERLRRLRVKERMEILRQLIPDSNKKDKTSTLDDAIRYIKMLQCHIQMTSMGTCSPMCNPLLPMAQITNNGDPNLPAFLNPAVRGGTVGSGMAMFPCVNHPMPNHFGLPDPCLSGSPAMTMPATLGISPDGGGHQYGIQTPGMGPFVASCATTPRPCGGVDGGDCVHSML